MPLASIWDWREELKHLPPPFMMRRKYSPLPVMRHKYPAKLRFQRAGERTRTARRCMPFSGARIQRLGLSRQRWVGEEKGREGRRESGRAGRLLLNFPREAGRRGGWDGWRGLPVRREEEIGVTRPARKLSLHERSSPSARRGPTGEVRGQWATVDVPHSAAVSSERAGQGSVWVRFVSFLCVCVRACVSLFFCHVLPPRLPSRTLRPRAEWNMW